jgi:hypothetical protein
MFIEKRLGENVLPLGSNSFVCLISINIRCQRHLFVFVKCVFLLLRWNTLFLFYKKEIQFIVNEPEWAEFS